MSTERKNQFRQRTIMSMVSADTIVMIAFVWLVGSRMLIKFTDIEIHKMLSERKPLPANFQTRLQFRTKRGHRECDFDIHGAERNLYRVIIRQNDYNPLDFSVILALNSFTSNRLFRLRHYNGKSHEHTNHVEVNQFYDFHIHYATERYQKLGFREDAYAEPTNRYADYHGALKCLLYDCRFELPRDMQLNLFGDLYYEF